MPKSMKNEIFGLTITQNVTIPINTPARSLPFKMQSDSSQFTYEQNPHSTVVMKDVPTFAISKEPLYSTELALFQNRFPLHNGEYPITRFHFKRSNRVSDLLLITNKRVLIMNQWCVGFFFSGKNFYSCALKDIKSVQEIHSKLQMLLALSCCTGSIFTLVLSILTFATSSTPGYRYGTIQYSGTVNTGLIVGGIIFLLVSLFLALLCYALIKLQARYVGLSSDSVTFFTILEKSQSHLAVRVLSNIIEALSLQDSEGIKHIESCLGPQPEEVGKQAKGSENLDWIVRFASGIF
jgi:hypothetical protein